MEQKYAIIENNVIVNIIIADEEWISQQQFTSVPYIGGSVGDSYIDGQVIKAEPTVINYKIAERSRLKLAIYRDGQLENIENAIKSYNGETAIWWNEAPTFNLDDERLLMAIDALNLTYETAQKWFNDANLIP